MRFPHIQLPYVNVEPERLLIQDGILSCPLDQELPTNRTSLGVRVLDSAATFITETRTDQVHFVISQRVHQVVSAVAGIADTTPATITDESTQPTRVLPGLLRQPLDFFEVDVVPVPPDTLVTHLQLPIRETLPDH